MKRTGKCPKCQSQKVIRLAHVADAGEWEGQGAGGLQSRTGIQSVPRRVLHRKVEKAGMFGSKSAVFEPTGETEGYICSECGYLEEHLLQPKSIDWSTIEGATWHKPVP
jgi:hypothetical protein